MTDWFSFKGLINKKNKQDGSPLFNADSRKAPHALWNYTIEPVQGWHSTNVSTEWGLIYVPTYILILVQMLSDCNQSRPQRDTKLIVGENSFTAAESHPSPPSICFIVTTAVEERREDQTQILTLSTNCKIL